MPAITTLALLLIPLAAVAPAPMVPVALAWSSDGPRHVAAREAWEAEAKPAALVVSGDGAILVSRTAGEVLAPEENCAVSLAIQARLRGSARPRHGRRPRLGPGVSGMITSAYGDRARFAFFPIGQSRPTPNPAPTPMLDHCVQKIAAIVADGSDSRRAVLQLGYNLGRLAELTGLGREPFWDRWKDAVAAWDRPALDRLARQLQADAETWPTSGDSPR